MAMPPSKSLVCSLLFGLSIVAIIGIIASFTTWTAIGVLLLPGMLLGALIFPQGIHSDFGLGYMVIAAAVNVAVYTLGSWMIFRALQLRCAE